MTNSTINQISELFNHYGKKTYGETCTQIQHAISSAWHAKQDGADKDLIVAAFLHDIGHFIADKKRIEGLDKWGHKCHDVIGSGWLEQNGFPASVYLPIRYHVQAKRYLAYKQKLSKELSTASNQTLKQQGGEMTSQQAIEFELNSCFRRAIALRYYDDLGKPTNYVNEDISPWLSITASLLKGT